jgi:hypothetical protein
MKSIATIMIAVLTVLTVCTVMASEKLMKVYILAGQSNMQGIGKTFVCFGKSLAEAMLGMEKN